VSRNLGFWTDLKNVAKAINKQPNLECQIAALTYMCMHVPPHNPRWFYLTVANTYQQQQDEIMQNWSSPQQGETILQLQSGNDHSQFSCQHLFGSCISAL